MRIAILTSGILPVPAVQGGAVENLVDFYLEYNEQHRLHDITIYSVWHPAVERHPALQSEVNHYRNVKVDTLWAKLKKKLFKWTHPEGYYHYTIEYFLHEVLKDLKRQSYDMIILENRPGFALRLKELTSAKLVYHLHNDLLNSNTRDAQKLYDAAARIITVSDYIKHCVQSVNTKDTKTITVHNGIDLMDFTIEKRKEHDASDHFTIIFMGRIIPEKGIDQLIDAMLKLHHFPDIRLVVVGGSNYANSIPSDFEQQLRQKAEPIKDRILFTDYIAHDKLYMHLQQADIAVLPSFWEEPFGLTCVEAMTAGLPLITTRSGGIPEICEGVATIVDKENIVDNLASAILDLYQHPEKRKAMSLASMERAKLFDKETYARNFFKALEL